MVTSPATCTWPVVIMVSTATRLCGSSLEQRVEDGVADLVSDLVRVALGDGLGGEEAAWPRHSLSLRRTPATAGRTTVVRLTHSAIRRAAYCRAVNATRSQPRGPTAGRASRSFDTSAIGTSADRRRRARSPLLSVDRRRPRPSPTSLTTSRSQPLRASFVAAVAQDVVGRRRSRPRRPPDAAAPGGRACTSRRARRGCASSSGQGLRFGVVRLLDLGGCVAARPEVGYGGGHHHGVARRGGLGDGRLRSSAAVCTRTTVAPATSGSSTLALTRVTRGAARRGRHERARSPAGRSSGCRGSAPGRAARACRRRRSRRGGRQGRPQVSARPRTPTGQARSAR